MEESTRQNNRELVTREGALLFVRNMQERVTAMFNTQGFVTPAAFVLMTWDPNKQSTLDPPLIGRIRGDMSDEDHAQAFREAVRKVAQTSKAIGVLTVLQLEEQEITTGATGNANLDDLFGLAEDNHVRVRDVVLLSFEHLRFATGLRVWSAQIHHSDQRAVLGAFEEISDVDKNASPFAGHLQHYN